MKTEQSHLITLINRLYHVLDIIDIKKDEKKRIKDVVSAILEYMYFFSKKIDKDELYHIIEELQEID